MKLRYGHAPGHVRETACDAFYAWLDWDGNSPEPTVEYEIGYVSHAIPISRACGLVWNCTDIVPGVLFDAVHGELETTDMAPKTRTYGALARAILEDLKARKAQAA